MPVEEYDIEKSQLIIRNLHEMNMTMKGWGALIVLLIVIAGVWFVWSQMTAPGTPFNDQSDTHPTSDQMQEATTTSNGISSQMNATSDADLNADLTVIDDQMTAAGSANASAQNFSDVPVPQEQ